MASFHRPRWRQCDDESLRRFGTRWNVPQGVWVHCGECGCKIQSSPGLTKQAGQGPNIDRPSWKGRFFYEPITKQIDSFSSSLTVETDTQSSKSFSIATLIALFVVNKKYHGATHTTHQSSQKSNNDDEQNIHKHLQIHPIWTKCKDDSKAWSPKEFSPQIFSNHSRSIAKIII